MSNPCEKQPLKVMKLSVKITHTQRGASDHSQGFEDKNLGSSPGLLGQ